jgi:hypothetical protein
MVGGRARRTCVRAGTPAFGATRPTVDRYNCKVVEVNAIFGPHLTAPLLAPGRALLTHHLHRIGPNKLGGWNLGDAGDSAPALVSPSGDGGGGDRGGRFCTRKMYMHTHLVLLATHVAAATESVAVHFSPKITASSYNGSTSWDEAVAALHEYAAAQPRGRLRVVVPTIRDAGLPHLVAGAPWVAEGAGVGGTNVLGATPVFVDNILRAHGIPWEMVPLSQALLQWAPTTSYTACVREGSVGHAPRLSECPPSRWIGCVPSFSH